MAKKQNGSLHWNKDTDIFTKKSNVVCEIDDSGENPVETKYIARINAAGNNYEIVKKRSRYYSFKKCKPLIKPGNSEEETIDKDRRLFIDDLRIKKEEKSEIIDVHDPVVKRQMRADELQNIYNTEIIAIDSLIAMAKESGNVKKANDFMSQKEIVKKELDIIAKEKDVEFSKRLFSGIEEEL